MSKEQRAPVALIGYRGVGKSAVARELARRLDYVAFDSDDLIEEQAGRSIAEIFAEQGEAHFRELEAAALRELVEKEGAVLALGGGAVLRPDNREALAACRAVVWLTASVDVLWERIGGDQATASRRPNLTNSGGRSEVERLLAQRRPIYRQSATVVVDTENKSPEEVAAEIADQLTQKS